MLLAKIVALSIIPAVALGAQGTSNAQDENPIQHGPMATISSSASADAKFIPDRATISISVQTKATTAAAAAADNAKKQNAVLSALRSLGMTNEQLSTTGYSVSPEYRYDPNREPTLTGYTVTNTVLADVHDLKQIGKVLDTALANGSNLISSLDFYSTNTETSRQQALADAVTKARTEAEVAAKAAGGSLGALVHLDVSGGGQPVTPRMMFSAKAMAAPAPETQVNPGQQTVTVNVFGDWRFVPNP
jgi:uncharacterized protein YggE